MYEIDEIDRKKMRSLAVLLIKIAKRLRGEELEIQEEAKELLKGERESA